MVGEERPGVDRPAPGVREGGNPCDEVVPIRVVLEDDAAPGPAPSRGGGSPGHPGAVEGAWHGSSRRSYPDRATSRCSPLGYRDSASARARSSVAPSPRQALPCIHASVAGRVDANLSSMARACLVWEK